MNRETAWRVFGREFNLSSCWLESEEEMAPNYLVTPSGALCNRVFVVGVLVGVEEAGSGMLKGLVSDPTGLFQVYAGRYQPEARDVLEGLEPPVYVAVTGKANGYRTDDGGLLCSIRLEEISSTDERARVNWAINTAWRTVERMKAFRMALDSGIEEQEKLVKYLESGGVREDLARGISIAVGHYEPGLDELQSIVKEGLSSFSDVEFDESELTPKIAVKNSINELDNGDGALYSEIIEHAIENSNYDEETVERALNDLLKKGRCYEPEPGQIKLI
ncbi:hypothetical protein [Methanonatronarchaeum sp. AMET-Sl]|uniref:hypothetical protein n=1 Tax=Methanonatronarchaeum sp. AMET-Sl TaxID=3037654 RepID=UPI00244DCA15|nr:hypothetical protein [Methanonatronarchaeum sp. AMET-Sl]WGI16898.1 hypothetical protein QEN48_05210 [Methanonatronarchaeum sp. AMET-Sl]